MHERESPLRRSFRAIARTTAYVAGEPVTFVTAVILVLAWAISGPLLGFSDVWQLSINTLTTIITFLMVFLLQYTGTRDMRALHIKLDELIRATADAHDEVRRAEELTDEEQERLRQEEQNQRPRQGQT